VKKSRASSSSLLIVAASCRYGSPDRCHSGAGPGHACSITTLRNNLGPQWTACKLPADRPGVALGILEDVGGRPFLFCNPVESDRGGSAPSRRS
jgi:hypothetical protein